MDREILRICTFLLLDIQKATIEEFQKLLQRSIEKTHLPEIIIIEGLGTHNRFCFSAKIDEITRNSDDMARVAHHVKMKMLTD